MLVLKRRDGEAVVINERIRVLVRNTAAGSCSLAIDAPAEDVIRREELAPRTEAVIQRTATHLRIPR